MQVGRSINLVMTSRGLHALTSLSADLAQKVMRVTTRVDGRTMHNRTHPTCRWVNLPVRFTLMQSCIFGV